MMTPSRRRGDRNRRQSSRARRAGAGRGGAARRRLHGGNRYAPPPPPEVTVGAAGRARGHDLQRVHRPHRRGRGGRHPRARAGLPAEHQLHARQRRARRATCCSSSSPTSTRRASTRREADLAGSEAQAQSRARRSSRSPQAIFAAQRRQPAPTWCRRRRQRDQAKAAGRQARPTSRRPSSTSPTRTSTRPIDGRIDRNLRRRRQPGRRRPGDACSPSIVQRRPDLRLLRRQRARPAAATASCSGAARRSRPTGEHNVGLPRRWRPRRLPARRQGRLQQQPRRSATGTIEVRAVFPNPDRVLVPGLFVARPRCRSRAAGALLVPDVAVRRRPGRALRARRRRQERRRSTAASKLGARSTTACASSTSGITQRRLGGRQRPAAGAAGQRREAEPRRGHGRRRRAAEPARSAARPAPEAGRR